VRDKKAKLWLKIRKQKIEEFASRGIVRCEMCNGQPPDDFSRTILDLAHSKKRRKIENEQEMAEVALLCRSCHNMVEYELTHEEMEKTIKEIIRRRDGNVLEIDA
jgi:uncharacterized protein with PIN domain